MIETLPGLSGKPVILSSGFYAPETIIPQNDYVTENEEGQLTNHLFPLQCCECNLAGEIKMNQKSLKPLPLKNYDQNHLTRLSRFGTDDTLSTMKNKILLFILLMTAFVSPLLSQENSSAASIKKIAVTDFNKLIIRSDITIMLIEDAYEDSVRMEGSREFIDKIMILHADKELVVRTKSFKDVKEKGIIYIPVNSLENIEINSDAKVVSYNALQSSVLNTLINSSCSVDIVLKGKLNIRELEEYDFTYRRVYENKKTPLV